MFSIVKYDDDVFDYVLSKKIMNRSGNAYSVKWKNVFYHVEIVHSNDDEVTCKSLIRSLNSRLPKIEVTKLDQSSFRNVPRSPSVTGFSDDSIADPHYNPSDDDNDTLGFNRKINDTPTDSEKLLVGNSNMSLMKTKLYTKEPKNISIENGQERTLLEKIKLYVPPQNSSQLVVNEIGHSKLAAKKYFCVYCKKLFSKLALHFERIHKDEPEVKNFSILPKGCEERKKIIEILRKEGCFQYNTEEKYNTGDMIVSRRPRKELFKSDRDYKTCPSCKGMYSKTTIRKHYPKCVPAWKVGDRSISVLSRRVRANVHKKACPILRDFIFPILREDSVTKIIRYDSLVIAYGNSLCLKYRLQHLHKMIRTKLRLMGRFIIEIKEIDSTISDLASIYYPNKFEAVIEAVNKVAQLDSVLQEYKSPATASNLGTTLKKCAKLLITICIKEGDEKRKCQVKDFLRILEEEFPAVINKTVTENQLQFKRNKQSKLPSMNDISLFKEYLDKKCDYFYRRLLDKFQFIIWKELASHTLIAIQTFNRRRAGEIERASVLDFKNHQTLIENDDPAFFESLPKEYQVNAKKYSRFEIRGKKARGVPVLLSKKLLQYVELILKTREIAGVSPENPYIFGIPGKSHVHLHLRACDLMRRFAQESGIENHHLIRGTQLRKQLATQSSVLNLDASEVSDLANFLGHADKIHRDHYRLPVVSREIGRVSKLLEIGLENDTPLELGHNSHDEDSHDIENILISSPKRDSWNELDLSLTTYGKRRCVSPIGPVKRTSWSTPEKQKAEELFVQNIESGDLPSLNACLVAIRSYGCLQARSPAQLKAWVANKIKQKNSTTNIKDNKRVYWTSDEKTIMYEAFKDNLKDGILPSLAKCANIRDAYPVLQNRNPTSIKAWINNNIRKKSGKQLL